MFAFRASVLALLVFPMIGLANLTQPKTEPEPRRAHLGVLLSPADKGTAGLMVRGVTPDSPAAKAGVKLGDRVVKIGDQDVKDIEKFLGAVAGKKPGDKLTLGIVRDGKEQSVVVTLGERTPSPRSAIPDQPGTRRPFLGVQTRALTPELKKQMKVEIETGAVVTDVVPNSAAAKAGVKRDDIIASVDGQPVKDSASLTAAIQKAGVGKEVQLQVIRGQEKLSLKATLREAAPGFLRAPGGDRFPMVGAQPMLNPARRIQELERRIADLEKQLRDREKK